MEELKEVERETSVRVEFELQEFLDLIYWFQRVLQYVSDERPSGLYKEKDGRMAVPRAVMDLLQEALHLDNEGMIDLGDARD